MHGAGERGLEQGRKGRRKDIPVSSLPAFSFRENPTLLCMLFHALLEGKRSLSLTSCSWAPENSPSLSCLPTPACLSPSQMGRRMGMAGVGGGGGLGRNLSLWVGKHGGIHPVGVRRHGKGVGEKRGSGTCMAWAWHGVAVGWAALYAS